MVLCPRPPPESASSSICFSHFCQWRLKAHSSLRNTALFPNCSGLLRCIKQGSHQFTTIFTTSGNASARVSFRKHGSASGRVNGMDQMAEQNWNNFFFYNSFHSGNCQNTEISVCTFQFYESPYIYGRTFTHDRYMHGAPVERNGVFFMQKNSNVWQIYTNQLKIPKPAFSK